ncbi:MAG TPA: LuxR C-terminal-related transcriptional regulator [Rubrobacteraceae bacterium]|nr:LuxR C-terminal-related transcriptional regulator [Rubrobacteraceae bacterium]
MFARTKRHLYLPAAVLVLSALVLALLPTVAEAQETAATPDAPGAERVVVRPGDSLWSISSDLLGPNASQRQIAEETGRIYALNRSLIGGDPNLIFVNQKLSLPPAAGQPAPEPSTGAAREEAGAARAASADRASQGTVSGPASERGEGSQVRADLLALPDAAAPAVPAVRSLASPDAPRSPESSLLRDVRSASVAAALVDSLAEVRANWDRRQLGKSIIALTFLVAVLIAWKLPMKRYIEASAWGVPSGYYGRYAYSEPLDRYGYALEVPVPAEAPDTLEEALKAPVAAFAPKHDSGGSDSGATTAENGLGGAGVIGGVRERRERTRRKRAPRSRRRSRGEAMSGAYGREVHQALSRATLKTRSPRSAKRRAGKAWRGSLAMAVMTSGHLGGGGLASEPSMLAADGDGLPDPRVLLLSARQWETLELAAEGLSNAQIARRLFITESTVKQHLRKAYSTLGIRNRREAAGLFGGNYQAGRRSAEKEVQS